MEQEPDFLDEQIAARTERNPDFSRLVEEAAERRRQARRAAYDELAQDEEGRQSIERANRAAADAGIL